MPDPSRHTDNVILPRVAERQLSATAAVMPVVVVMGARQTGKSTIVQEHPVFGGYPYLTLDNSDIRSQARLAPADLLARAPRLVIDEVQRDPELVMSLKAFVDGQRRRNPGQFVLTGSANLLEMKRVKESLAGRAAYTTLWPLTRREQLGLGAAGTWSDFFTTPRDDWMDMVQASPAPADDWREVARVGGYPTPATQLATQQERAIWHQGYVDTYLDRDIQDLAAVANALDMRRLMRVACLRVGQVMNRAEWARDAGISATTVFRYLDLLETSYQLVRIEAFAVNRTKRLIKSPKAYWSDTGLALHLAGYPPLTGFHLENIVLGDLIAWRDSLPHRPSIMHWRTTGQDEVDFVIEDPQGALLPIEVKAGANPGYADAAGVRLFLDEYGNAIGGLLLHGGEETFWISNGVLATPWWRVL